MSQDFPFEHFFKSKKEKVIPGQDLVALIAPPKTNSETNIVNQDDLSQLNQQILDQLKEVLPSQKYNTFIEHSLFLKNITENSLEFSVKTAFIKTMIELHYMDQLQKAVYSQLGKSFKIELIVEAGQIDLSPNDNNILHSLKRDPSTKCASPKDIKFKLELNETEDDLISKVESRYIDHMSGENHGILIDQSKTFDNFIVGSSNNLAFATTMAAANDPGKNGKYPSLYIHSNSGLGKTHLLHAVANLIRDKYPSMVVCLITAREFMKEMISAMQQNKLSNFQKKYAETIDVLMIDDIHELKNKQGTQNEFFHVFNELHNKGKQLIFTSDKSPKEIDGIEERLKTRLQWGLVIDIQKPDFETRIAILKKKACELDLFLTDDVLNVIASSVQSSIRELEGALIKLSAFADVMNVEIDIEIVRDLLSFSPIRETSNVTLESIAKATAQFYKVHLPDLKSKARGKQITHARHIAMFLSRKILNATQKEIGIFFGGRDHTSVIHGINRVTDQVNANQPVASEIHKIENSLKN